MFMLAALMVFTTACSSGEKKEEANGKKEITVTFRSSGSNDSLTKYFNAGLVEEFEKENQDIKVNLAPILASEGDYFSKVVLQMKSSDTSPDLIAEDTSILKSDAEAGYLEPLDSKVEAWSDWSNIIPNLKAGVTGEDGKVYGIPATSDTRGLWYNKDLFKKAGLPVPWEPKTWEEVLDAARTITGCNPNAHDCG